MKNTIKSLLRNLPSMETTIQGKYSKEGFEVVRVLFFFPLKPEE